MTLARAISDWKRFTSEGGFETPITFTPPSGGSSVTINGLAIKHHISIDTDGVNTGSMNAHLTISESELDDAGYPIRDANNVVNMKNHLVKYTDSTGVEGEYIIKQVLPDETVDVITFILGEYGSP